MEIKSLVSENRVGSKSIWEGKGIEKAAKYRIQSEKIGGGYQSKSIVIGAGCEGFDNNSNRLDHERIQ
jgi:hypothetical protein